ncbi:Trp biosynthesis-associated membrane protein [Nocardioides jensenii]|uniref:Trp biosynthesis-associated membrane protein n=1 Tax=Nocardioides jensenii TaxID=1843 RepID=UPI00082D790A|nr:Trp biosynthesis-associated membrane protein [Nocardioides jensenii]
MTDPTASGESIDPAETEPTPAEPAAPKRPRSTFGPVLLLGLVGAALAAVGGNKAWYAVPDAAANIDAPVSTSDQFALDMPLAGALALVLLAAWGVLLVTRGWVRRAVAGLALISSLGLALTYVQAVRTLPDDLADKLADSGTSQSTSSLDAGFTGWFWAAGAGIVISVVATALALRWVPSWPTMGSKYDAPSSSRTGPVDVERANDGELWKAIDEGHDPTL